MTEFKDILLTTAKKCHCNRKLYIGKSVVAKLVNGKIKAYYCNDGCKNAAEDSCQALLKR